mmetsp:Transcript_64541/g.147864  ORF Transcript_64541/g.147864 Transcript_64541/m.147864 type:complete len:217 (+) Transcript_64541:2405-3055(+)
MFKNFIVNAKLFFDRTIKPEEKILKKSESKLEKFSRNLKGEWSNLGQATEFPALWSHIRVFYHELPTDLLDEKSFYIESVYDYMIDKPYKTAVVSLKESKEKIVMSNYRIIQPEDFWFGSRNPGLLIGLTKDRLFATNSACDIIFTYDEDENKFYGQLKKKKKCLVSKKGLDVKTYLDCSMIVGEKEYASWDTGRDINTGKQVWGGSAGPFCFKKN